MGKALGVGAVTGFVMGAYNRHRNLKKDFATHRADSEYGKKVDTTAREGLKGKIADKLDTDKQLERFRLQHMASVKDLLESNEDRYGVAGDARSLNSLMSLDISPTNAADRQALVRRVAEIQARMRFSSDEKKGFIDFGGKVTTEQGRLALVKGIAQGREKLIEAVVAEGRSRVEAETEINDLLRTSRGKWNAEFTIDARTQEDKFNDYKAMSALTHGVIGSAAALGFGLGFQEVAATVEGVVNPPVNPTLVEQALNIKDAHQLPHGPEVRAVHEALLNHDAKGISDNFDKMGIGVKTEPDGHILLTSYHNATGEVVTVPAPPQLTFDEASDSFHFQGEVPQPLAAVLDHEGFHVDTHGALDAFTGQSGTRPETLANGTKVEIPAGTQLKEGPNNTYELWTIGTGTPQHPDTPGPIHTGTKAPEFTATAHSAPEGGVVNPVKIADGVRFDSSGSLVNEHILRADLLGTTETAGTGTKAIDTNEWMEQHKSGMGVENWVNNGTPQKSDLDELQLRDFRTPGKDHAVTIDASHMSDNHFIDAKTQIQKGNGVVALWQRGNPGKIDILMQIPPDGKLDLDQMDTHAMVNVWTNGGWKPTHVSEVAQMYMKDNLGDFKGGSESGNYRELFTRNLSMGTIMNMDGGQPHFQSLATIHGTGDLDPTILSQQGTTHTSFVSAEQTTVTFPYDKEAPLITTSVTPRRHLRQEGKRAESYPATASMDKRPAMYGYGYGYGSKDIGLLNRETEYAARRSETLKADSEAKLDEKAEVKAYMDGWDPTYKSELEAMDSSIGRTMDAEARAAVTIPAFEEGRNIKKTLEQFVDQKNSDGTPLDPKAFEIIIVDNHPSAVAKDTTEDEIRAFQTAHPEIRVIYAHKEWGDGDAPTVGNARRYATDLALLRSSKRPSQSGDLILISGDADVEGVSQKYIADYIKEFDANERVDAIGGRWNLPEWALENPNVKAAQRFWYSLDRLIQMDAIGEPKDRQKTAVPLVGRNAAVRASIYAGVGGYNPNAQLAEDLELGWLITEARGWKPDRFKYINRSEVVSNPRRFLATMASGRPILQQYEDFHEDPSIRRMDNQQLLSRIPKEFDRARLERELDTFWQAGQNGQYEHLGDKFPQYFQRASNLLGVEYVIENGHVTVTNTQRYEATIPKERTATQVALAGVRQQGQALQNSLNGQSIDIQRDMASRVLNRPLTPDEEALIGSDPNWGQLIAERAMQERLSAHDGTQPDQSLESTIDIGSADTLLTDINEKIRTTTEGEHAFSVTPDVFADYLMKNPNLLGDKVTLKNLEAKILDGKLVLNGSMTYGGDKSMVLENATFSFAPTGELVLAQPANYRIEGLNVAQRPLSRLTMRNAMRNVDESIRVQINSEITDENWGVDHFAETDGNILIQVKRDPALHIVRTSSELATSPERVVNLPPPDHEATGAFDPLASEVITDIDSAGNFTELINKELGVELGDSHMFALEPHALAEYIKVETNRARRTGEDERLFGGKMNFSDLNIHIEGNQIIMGAKYNYKNRADMHIKRVVFEVDDDGKLIQVGKTKAKNNKGILQKKLDIAALDLRDFGDHFSTFMNQRIDPEWNANGGYEIIDGKLGMRAVRRPEVPDDPTDTIQAVPPPPDESTGETPAVETATDTLPKVDTESTAAGMPPIETTDEFDIDDATQPITRVDSERRDTLPEMPIIEPTRGEIYRDADGNEYTLVKVNAYDQNVALRPSRRDRQNVSVVLQPVGGKRRERQTVDYDTFFSDINRPGGQWRSNAQPEPEQAQAETTEIPRVRGLEGMAERLSAEPRNEHIFSIQPDALSELLVESTNTGNPDGLFGGIISFKPGFALTVEGDAIVLNGDCVVNGALNMHMDNIRYHWNEHGELVTDDLGIALNEANADESKFSLESLVNPADRLLSVQFNTMHNRASATIRDFGMHLETFLQDGLKTAGQNDWQIGEIDLTKDNNFTIRTVRKPLQQAA